MYTVSYDNQSIYRSEVILWGVIYIVRDPRNIVTSMKNHYSLPKCQCQRALGNVVGYENRGIKKIKIMIIDTNSLLVHGQIIISHGPN